MLRVRRSRGALSGVLLVLLGIWGALIAFVGPYFHYAYTPDKAWDFNTGRLWFDLLPGVAALVAGVLVLISRLRPVAVLGTWLAAAAGVWFAVGGLVAHQWTSLPSPGTPVGGSTRIVLEQLGFFIGLGVAIVFVAGLAMGRLTLKAARDVVPVSEPEPSIFSEVDTAPRSSALARRLRLPSPVVRSKGDAAESTRVGSRTR